MRCLMEWLTNNFELVIFFGIAGLLLFALIYAFYLEKKRTTALVALAPRMGFSYKIIDVAEIEKHKYLKLFSVGRRHRMTNIMEGEKNGVRVILADYHYTTGSGKNSSAHNQTICLIDDESLNLPDFYLRREFAFLDSLGKLFGGQDINFPSDQKFSSAFVLQGSNEAATRELFKDRVRGAFLRFADTTTQVAGHGKSLVIHQGMSLEPEKWPGLLKDTFAIYEVLKKPEGSILG